MSIAVAHGHPFSIDDLDQFPDDDGLRYELIEGCPARLVSDQR